MPNVEFTTSPAVKNFIQDTNKSINELNRMSVRSQKMLRRARLMRIATVVLATAFVVKIIAENWS